MPVFDYFHGCWKSGAPYCSIFCKVDAQPGDGCEAGHTEESGGQIAGSEAENAAAGIGADDEFPYRSREPAPVPGKITLSY